MKTKSRYLLIVFLIAICMLFGVFAITPLTASAANVSEVVYASNLVDGDDIVLIGDTTLYVNAD
ncbi:MAG: hypothetical protein IJB32_00345, partial [Clostridia bacterium]|nr:hypothetical protein [Clostridia bacterium]